MSGTGRVPRTPSTDAHAEQAVALFLELIASQNLGVDEAWVAVAQLLMTTQVWDGGVWRPLHGELVLMERNNYKLTKRGEPNQALRDAAAVGAYIAQAIGVNRAVLDDHVGLFFKRPEISGLQPNNLRGHAFRSLVATTLDRFGDPALEIYEEQPVRDLFPGWDFGNRSEDARIDITVRRAGRIVALISTRWTYRHDRVDMIDEARAYIPAARNANRTVRFFGVTAEMGTARLKKVINEAAPIHPNPAIQSLVHLKPELASSVIGNNGTLRYLVSLADFVRSSTEWH